MRSPRARAVAALIAMLLLADRDARAQGPAPAVDCAAAFNDAGALRDRHSLKEARAKYQVCSLPACPSFIAMCASLAQEVSAAIPSLVVQAKDVQGHDLTAVTVTMDGEPFARSLDGVAIEVDPPGKHTLHFQAEGYEPVTKDVVVLEGKKNQVDTVTLEAVKPVPSPPPPPPGVGPALPPPDIAPPTSSGTWSTQKSLALAAGGVGVAALVVGSILGVSAGSTWSTAKSECQPNACGNGSAAQGDRSSALDKATLSTVFFVAGGLAAGGGALLWLTAPTGQTPAGTGLRVTPAVSPTGASLSVAGAF